MNEGSGERRGAPAYLLPVLIGSLVSFLLGLVLGMVWSPLGRSSSGTTPPAAGAEDAQAEADEATAPAAEPEPVPEEPVARAADDTADLVCFRGNPQRNLSGVGSVPRHPKLIWRFRTKTKHEGPYEQRGDPLLTSSTPWHGLGWTGQPCIVDGRVYFGSTDSYVYCLDLATGREIWHYGLHHSIKGSISVIDGAIFHGGRDNKVRRYDLDGRMVWETRIGQDTDSNPIVADGKLLIGGEDNTVYAFDPDYGSVIWSYGPTNGSCESSPCYAEDTVTIGSSGGSLYCLNAKTGDLIWEYATGGDGDPTPVYSEGRIYHAAEMGGGRERGKVHCLDLGTGELVWSRDMPRGIWATPAVSPERGRVYIGCNDGTLYCLDTSDGSTLWERELTGARIWSSPVVSDGAILVGVRDGTLWCLDESMGEPIWVFDEGYDIDATPAVAQGMIVVGSQNGWVYGIADDPSQARLNPHWFRAGPDYDLRTDLNPVGVRTIESSAPEPQAHRDTHAGYRESYLEPVYGPAYTRMRPPR
ncbi:MAG: PQQ-binding-like beta-propeller repeat protein [Armatimonadia bacterium]|nr:PQQ-binding-like beta-propeller repeat protein [Armatimonadia bacterium]